MPGPGLVDGQKLGDLDQRGLLRLRRERIGFVFQSFGLLPFLSARENAGVPLRMLRRPAAKREERITELLTTVGLAGHAEQRPAELRRPAAAAGCDRPRPRHPAAPAAGRRATGQLDSGTGQQVIALLRDLVHGSQSAALVATHDPALVSFADRVLHLRDGRLEDTP